MIPILNYGVYIIQSLAIRAQPGLQPKKYMKTLGLPRILTYLQIKTAVIFFFHFSHLMILILVTIFIYRSLAIQKWKGRAPKTHFAEHLLRTICGAMETYDNLMGIADEETRRRMLENRLTRDPVLAAVHECATFRQLARSQWDQLRPSPQEYFEANKSRKQKEAVARKNLNKRKRDTNDG